MGPRMRASRALLGSFVSLMQIPAIATAPYGLTLALEDAPLIYVPLEIKIALLMLLFSDRNRFEHICDFFEALLTRNFCE